MAEEKIEKTDEVNKAPTEDTTPADDATVVQSLASIAAAEQAAADNKQQPVIKTVRGDFVGAMGNDLYAAASTLLDIAAELRRPHTNIDLAKLRQSLTAEINAFNLKAKNKGIAETQITLARYILCAVFDEFVLDTPWGANSNWSEYSLLNTFHQDSSGGAKFFDILDKMQQEPATNLAILEIIYTCLALGYLGKYRITNGGKEQLATVTTSVYRQIMTQRRDLQTGFTSNDVLLQANKVNKVKRVPVMRLMIITLVSLILIFTCFKVLLMSDAKTTLESLRHIVVESTVSSEGKRVAV